MTIILANLLQGDAVIMRIIKPVGKKNSKDMNKVFYIAMSSGV